METLLRHIDIHWEDLQKETYLDKQATHVFKIKIEEYDLQFKARYNEVLTEEEFSASKKFRYLKDARRYLVSRYVRKSVLSRMINTPPSAIQFQQIANKKPSLAEIEFNLSHSGNYIILAIGCVPIGVDIEFVKPEFDTKLLIEHCFGSDEQSFISKRHDHLVGFYELWTRKEAILKASGEGLTDQLKELNCLGEIVHRSGKNYHIQTFNLDYEYIGSLAVLNGTIEHTFYWNYNI